MSEDSISLKISVCKIYTCKCGEKLKYLYTVTNNSTVNTVTLQSLNDSEFGNIPTFTPTTLGPNGKVTFKYCTKEPFCNQCTTSIGTVTGLFGSTPVTATDKITVVLVNNCCH